MRVIRWGRAEYEVGDLQGLLPGHVVSELDGPPDGDLPFEAADVLVVPSVRKVTAAVVARLRRCRLVLTTTSGFDHVDVAALGRAGILAARLPLARRDAVVHTTLGMMLSLTRRLPALQAAAEAGRWERDRLHHHGATLLGTVGVVGVGVIGQRMLEVLAPLARRVLFYDPLRADSTPVTTLLAESDVVSLHCELNADNRGWMSADRIATLRPGAVLLNTARGRLLDVEAAVAAVRSGHLAGLGVDVFPEEPADLARYAGPRVLVTPHAAGWHPGLWDDIRAGVRAAVEALERGEEVPFRVGAVAAAGGAPAG